MKATPTSQKISPAKKLSELVRMPIPELKRDFARVAEMQRHIMPDPTRVELFGDYAIHGDTRPAAIAGGDYYDFIDLEGRFNLANRLGIVVADASGHGLPATMLVRDFNTALYMGISFQAHYEEDTTALLFQKMNRRMFRSSQDNQFISCFCGELHKNGVLRYVNAGHPSPILVQGPCHTRLDTGGIALGLFRDPPVPFQVGEIRLEPGSVLICFTDGIVEAMDPGEKEYGTGRLIEIAKKRIQEPAHSIFDAIMNDVADFSRGREADDDQTLVVIKRGPGPR